MKGKKLEKKDDGEKRGGINYRRPVGAGGGTGQSPARAGKPGLIARHFSTNRYFLQGNPLLSLCYFWLPVFSLFVQIQDEGQHFGDGLVEFDGYLLPYFDAA